MIFIVHCNFQEELQRKTTFVENMKYIEEHNSRSPRYGEKTYRLRMNHLGDLVSYETKA